MKKITILLGLLFSLTRISFAQEQTEFQEFISNTFEQKLSHLTSTSDVPDFLKSFSRELSWRNVTVAIDGRVDNPELHSKSDLERKVNYLASRSKIDMSWEIMQYNELTHREKSYIATMNVKVKLYANGEMIREGMNNVQIVAEKKEGFFIISYMDILQISVEEYIGTCYVQIEAENDKIFSVDVAYPNGNIYKNFSSKITVMEAGPFKRFNVANRDQPFYWNNETNDVSLEKNGKKIGNANSMENVILIIVKTQGKGSCSEVIRTALKK